MNPIVFKVASLLALAATIVPSVLCFAGLIDLSVVKTSALIGTLVWFAATPFWMSRDIDPEELHPGSEPSVEI
ncbi:hypothetical protein SH528x_003728 [Novipirellula sp. SH528]|uniref:hypothetical protein n=1 Tax=Novipirellula sp. SH528 TaxID=3454466 RepID=UPI003F9F8F21